MKLRIADIINDSIVDGPGIRLTVFTQGCEHNCKGCHNPATHDLNGGRLIEIEEILAMIDKNPLLDGVTLSGGEPFLQTEPLTELCLEIKKRGFNIICYTGYTWEVLMEDSEKNMKLIELLDYIIDGPFIEEQKSLMLNFRGSANQRIIDVKDSLERGQVIIKEL